MATVVNVFDLAKEVTARGLWNPDLGNDNTYHNLIIIKEAALEGGNVSSTIVLNNDVASSSCCFFFNLTTTYHFHGHITFSGKILNPQYEVTLYYINSKYKLQLLETLNLPNVKPNSTYHFGNHNEVFYERVYIAFTDTKYVHVPNEDKFINGHLCLYCNITKKCISPMKIQIPRKEMLSQFFSFYNEKQLTDFKIICQEEEFLVHKLVLAAESPVFRNMFKSSLEDSRTDEIVIDDYGSKTVEKMIHFIYTDEIQVDLREEELRNLIMIADKYSLQRLKMLCIQERAKYVKSVSEALEAFSFGESCDVLEMKEAVVQFIKENKHIL